MDEIHVRSVYSADQAGIFLVAFETHSSHGLIFQVSERIDSQDSMLGMDGYSLSTTPRLTVYGGVTDAALRDSLLVLRLSSEAADALGLSDELRLRLPDDTSVGVAVAGLRRIGVNVRNL